MRTSLFRPEAMLAKRASGYGDVMRLDAPGAWLYAALAILLTGSLLAFACWGEYTRKAHVRGQLVPSMGQIKVQANEGGTIVEQRVREGQRVRKGDVLFVLSLERNSRTAADAHTTAIEKLRERRASLLNELQQQDELVTAKQRTQTERARGIAAQLAQLDQELGTQRQLVASAQGALRRYRTYQDQKFFSAAHVQQKHDEVLGQTAKLQALMRERVNLEHELNLAQQAQTTERLQSGKEPAQLKREIAMVEQQLSEYAARRNAVITAPADGVATSILAQPGQVAAPNSTLLSLLPAGSVLRAELFIPSRAIGFVEVRQMVALRYAAFPYQSFGSYAGKITEISRTIVNPGESDPALRQQEPGYRVLVDLESQQVRAYGKQLALQSGMALEADVALERRRLIEWVFAPLLSITGRV